MFFVLWIASEITKIIVSNDVVIVWCSNGSDSRSGPRYSADACSSLTSHQHNTDRVSESPYLLHPCISPFIYSFLLLLTPKACYPGVVAHTDYLTMVL